MVKQIIEEVTKEELEKVVNLQDEITNTFIVLVKPRAKESIFEYDTDYASIDILDNNLIFDFGWDDDRYSSIIYPITNVKKIVYEQLGQDVLIVHLHMKYGNDYMLHFMSK